MSPLHEYRARQSQFAAKQKSTQQTFITIGNLRLLTFLIAALLAYFIYAKNFLPAWTLLVPAFLFIALVSYHQRILRQRTFAQRAINLYTQAINRLEDRWAGHGNSGDSFRDPNHIYADDLDLFGRGGLFELLSNCRTAAGECTLARWLLAPAGLAEAIERQSAINELAPKLGLREEMALLGEDINSSVNAESLPAWGTAPPVAFPTFLRVAAFVLAIAGIAALILKWADILPLSPILIIVGINAILIFFFRRQTDQVHAAIETSAHNLSLLSLLVQRLEGEAFISPGLQSIQSALSVSGAPASLRIRRLNRWLDLLDSSDHILLRVLMPLTLYKQQVVMAIESWRAENGIHIGSWVKALAHFEALSSLGALHYERPQWCFPSLTESGPPAFAATELGHPLISADIAVRNSLTLNSECRVFIVSGSNMSGKSTLLRAVGLNTVLAWAGAPVCATALHISPLQTAASLRVSDSLQDNRSRFFAEITRLSQIVDLTKHATPVLFLLDELLSGTNSHDRRIGAAGILRGLLAANTLGLLTTHDLALAQLDQDTGVFIRNVHFEDRIIDGKIQFDYHLRPGVVTHSNALELMRSIGLEI